ncbi:hypothetical protein [Phocaeicola sp.]
MVNTYRRGGLNPPESIPTVYLLGVFGRIQSAPTVGGNVLR